MNKKQAILLAIILMASLLILLLRPSIFASHPDFSPGHYVSVEISIVDVKSRQYILEMKCSDTAVVQSFVKVLNTARASPDHKCMAIGILKLISKEGTSSDVPFLPGHDPGLYEIRFGSKKFDLPREEFLSSLEALGVPRDMIPLREH